MAKKDKQTEVTKPVLTPTVMMNNVVLQPIGASTNGVMQAGDCQFIMLDKDGNEIPGTEAITSVRMWDKVYSLQTTKFKLKKK